MINRDYSHFDASREFGFTHSRSYPLHGAYFIASRVTSFVIFSCPRITVTVTFSPSE